MALLLVLLLGTLAVPASAASAASGVDIYCTVHADGDCQVTMTVTLRLEDYIEGLTFPLPVNATDISLNGAKARTTQTGSSVDVDLSRVALGMIGEFPVRFDFTVPDVVKVTEERTLQLELPLLSSFELPVQELSFVITMPDNIRYKPTFSSIYQQTGIEASLKYDIDKNMMTGHSVAPLKDHEAITMNMVVDRDKFPTISTNIRQGNPEVTPMLIFAGLALVYWILFLRTWPLIRTRSVTPPEGITAGEMGCHLTLAGGDLTMMVFNWAQMGYILIYRDGGRVMLHKRMDMGNERSPFEVKVYKMLFANRRAVEATGFAYTRLSRKVFSMIPGERDLCKPNSGNTRIFRLLACISQMFCGICVEKPGSSSA